MVNVNAYNICAQNLSHDLNNPQPNYNHYFRCGQYRDVWVLHNGEDDGVDDVRGETART